MYLCVFFLRVRVCVLCFVFLRMLHLSVFVSLLVNAFVSVAMFILSLSVCLLFNRASLGFIVRQAVSVCLYLPPCLHLFLLCIRACLGFILCSSVSVTSACLCLYLSASYACVFCLRLTPRLVSSAYNCVCALSLVCVLCPCLCLTVSVFASVCVLCLASVSVSPPGPASGPGWYVTSLQAVKSLARSSVPYCTQDFLAAKAAKIEARAAKASKVEENKASRDPDAKTVGSDSTKATV